MSKEIKLKLLNYAKELIVTRKNIGICGALVNGMWQVDKEGIVEFDELQNICMEVDNVFQKYKPEGIAANKYWWPDFDVISRVTVLSKMIEEHELLPD